MAPLDPPGGGRRQRVGRHGPPALRRDRGPYKKWGGDNADAFYCYAPIDPTRTYRVRFEPGRRRLHVAHRLRRSRRRPLLDRIVGSANSQERRATPTAPSTSSSRRTTRREPGVAWIRLEPDAVAAITRDYLDDPRAGRRAAWHIEADDPPETFRQDDADLARRLRAATTWVREQASIVPLPLGTPNAIDPPYPVPTTTFGWAAGDAAYAMGAFELADDQALVIRGRSPECVFWNMCLWNRLLHTYNYDYERVTINGAQVHYEPDGSWTIVVAARRPAPSQLGLDRRPPVGPDLVPLVPPRRDTRAASGRGPPGRHRMSDRPAPVRIDDLADPRFSDEVRAILDFMEEAGSQLTLDPAALMAAARARPGLDDFGAGGLRRAARPALPRHARGGRLQRRRHPAQHTLILGLLKNRLLIEDLIARHPEILEEEIAAPIVICGLPRTGTTHLHNLMSADPALRSLPYWESLEPVLADRERPAAGAPDPRRERTAMALSFLDAAMPYFNRMHEMTVDHAHEEIQLLAIDFSTMLFETTAPMPTWRDAYLARDQRPSYAYLRRSSRCSSGCGAAPAGSSSPPSTSSSSPPSSRRSPTPPSSSPTATRSR